MISNEDVRIKSLYDVSILDTMREERFDRITNMGRILLEVPICIISLVDVNRQWFKSCQGLSVTETPRSISFCAHAINQDEIFIVENAMADDRFKENPLVIGKPYIRFYAGRPIHGADDYNIGTLCIIDTKARKLSFGDKKILNDLAEWVDSEIGLMVSSANLIKVNEELRKTMRTKQELFAMINHDLINCLSPIISISQLLLLWDSIDPKLLSYIHMINDSSKKMELLTKDILDILKIELKMFKIQKRKIKIEKLLNLCLTNVSTLFYPNKKNLSITIGSNSIESDIYCDFNRIEQVIINLCKNSYDFVQPNGKIEIVINREKDDIIFKVIDNGIGIPPNKIDQLFNNFAKDINIISNRRFDGNGLGLSICKGIVESHGGKIWYEDNNKNENISGAIFVFSIPEDKCML